MWYLFLAYIWLWTHFVWFIIYFNDRENIFIKFCYFHARNRTEIWYVNIVHCISFSVWLCLYDYLCAKWLWVAGVEVDFWIIKTDFLFCEKILSFFSHSTMIFYIIIIIMILPECYDYRVGMVLYGVRYNRERITCFIIFESRYINNKDDSETTQSEEYSAKNSTMLKKFQFQES